MSSSIMKAVIMAASTAPIIISTVISHISYGIGSPERRIYVALLIC
jgi:hypothetical protein